jgi:hypothetical protein
MALTRNLRCCSFPATLNTRLCGLAKAAHRNDLRLNPALVIDWDFAAAVSKLNGHPMSWLLQWAGVKVRRPWWDRWLLIAAALLLISSFATAALLAGTEPWTPFRWAGVGAVYVVVFVVCFAAESKNGSCSGTLRDAVATPALPSSNKILAKITRCHALTWSGGLSKLEVSVTNGMCMLLRFRYAA